MLIVNYTTSYKALDHFVDSHNDKHQELTEKIKASVLLTAKEIIRIYGAFLLKANSFMELTASKLPALKTNNYQLAKLVKVSNRTIQRHIIKLQEAGIIIGKQFCGSNSGYELLISPKILLATCRKDQEQAKSKLKKLEIKSTNNQSVKEGGATKCPHTYTSNTSNNKSNLLIGVDKLKENVSRFSGSEDKRQRRSLSLTSIFQSTGYNTGNTFTGNTREKVVEKIDSGPGRGYEAREKVLRRARVKNWKQQDITEARRTSLCFYADRLWDLAKTLLYKDVFLTEFQEDQAKEMLTSWYEPVDEKKLSKVHQNYCERIVMVCKFIARDPENRFVQLPYKYFDQSNPSGFTGTKKWYQKHMIRKEEVRKKRILHSQIKKYFDNERRTDDKRRPLLKVYRECETRIGKLNDNDLLNLFYTTVLKPETIQYI